MLKDRLRLFASEDLALAEAKGHMAIFDTKAGTIFVSYNEATNQFKLDCQEKGWVFTGPKSEMINVLVNSYNIDEVVNKELKKIWRPM